MNFAPFDPDEKAWSPVSTMPAALRPVDPRTPVEVGHSSIESLKKQLGPTAKELESHYLGTCDYYYIPETNTIWEIEYVKKVLRKPSGEVEGHIRALNQLPAA
jgi:hypothetical protein